MAKLLDAAIPATLSRLASLVEPASYGGRLHTNETNIPQK
jgi:hypothetical protein